MCGIAGMAGAYDPALVGRMTDALAHRGPDASGLWECGEACLGHRRLSIIDLSSGAQPMHYANNRYTITFNGEIYNFQELRKRLEGLGRTFATRSDTEVILAAYDAWGEGCVDEFEGMFAFALWDDREKTLFIARDPVGIKPLYYTEQSGRLLFASEIKALLLSPDVDRTVDLEAMDDYLTFLHTMPPRTFYRGIRQIPPGHCATWRRGRLAVRRYWRLNERIQRRDWTAGEWRDTLLGTLERVIRLHMIADVPVGAFLSGGLDSTTIVSFMGEQGASPLTFTVGFGGEGSLYDERAQAREVSRHLGTKHHELVVEPRPETMAETVLRHFDEPFANPTALLTHEICREVGRHVKVVLSGDGGDECFGGYPRYRGVALSQTWRAVLPMPIRVLLDRMLKMLPENTQGRELPRRIREFSAGNLLEPDSMYALWMSHFTPEQKKSLYTDSFSKQLSGRDSWEPMHAFAREVPGMEPVNRAMYVDVHTFLPNNLLQYSDRMSMAHGLESRVPFADYRLIETMAAAPSRLKATAKRTKILLRDAMSPKLPKSVISAPKQGFTPPMGAWLNGCLGNEMNLLSNSPKIVREGYFTANAIDELITSHQRGFRDHSLRIWALLVFNSWLEKQ